MASMENNFSYNPTLPIKYIRPGVKAFIVHQGKILVVKERVQHGDQKMIIYDLPGGGIEPGESLKDALLREVKEEVGLDIEIERAVGNWDFIIPSLEDSNFNVQIVCLGYQCKSLSGTKTDVNKNPAEQEDIFETLWMNKAEILALKNDVFAKNKEIRKALEFVQI